jgi:CRP-like cAMP-binding protein
MHLFKLKILNDILQIKSIIIKVEITTKKGHLVSILRHGDFFGEGSLLEERNHRFTSARCATPVDLIKVSREDFNAYIAASKETKQSLKQKYKSRCLLQAKQLIRMQAGLAKRSLKMNEICESSICF